MSVISYGVSTELDAVNSILMSVGETPVNTLTVQSPEVAIAQKTLRQICREVQAEGWSYNTENEYPIDTDTNNQFKGIKNMENTQVMVMQMDHLYIQVLNLLIFG